MKILLFVLHNVINYRMTICGTDEYMAPVSDDNCNNNSSSAFKNLIS